MLANLSLDAKTLRRTGFELLPLLLLLVSCASSPPQSHPPIRFCSESITITIHASYVLVEGIYCFENLDEQARVAQFFYPFPIDDHHPYPHSIEVEGLPFRRANSGIFWAIRLGPLEKKKVKVRYAQRLFKPSARYILTTTQVWKRPIQLARFTVTVPSSFEKVNLSYPPDSLRLRGDRVFYYLEKRDFSPEADLEIWWSGPVSQSDK